MRTRHPLLVLLALLVALPAYAQFVGPGSDAPKPVDVKSILANPLDDQWVSLKGNILEKIGREEYTFTDDTGQIRLDIDDRYFPSGAAITPKTTVQISGNVDIEVNRTVEIDVKKILIMDQTLP